MIKPNELRIGNYITEVTASAGFYASVISIGVDTCTYSIGYWASFDKLAPIPLTEKWLLDFGFEKENNPFYKYWNIGINPISKDPLLSVTYNIKGNYYFFDNAHHQIKHVHQLQNLYFALTGEELTLKP